MQYTPFCLILIATALSCLDPDLAANFIICFIYCNFLNMWSFLSTFPAMLAVVLSLYCPLINTTGLKVVFMFVKDTIWSLFFPKSPENALIYPQKSQQSTFKWCDFSGCLLHSNRRHCKALQVEDWSHSSMLNYHISGSQVEFHAKEAKPKFYVWKYGWECSLFESDTPIVVLKFQKFCCF